MNYYTFQPVGKSTPNFPLLLEALRRVRLLDQARQFDLGDIAQDYDPKHPCSAICCVIGMAVVQEDFPSAGWSINRDSWLIDPEGRSWAPARFSEAGADIFKVTGSDAYTLFTSVQYDERYIGESIPVVRRTDLQVFEMRLQTFFKHHGQPFQP